MPAQPPPTPRDLCETRPVDSHGAPRAPFAAGDIPNIQQSDALANPTNEGQTVLTNGVNVGARAGTPANPGQLSPTAKTFHVGASQQVRLQLLNASTTRYMRLRLTTPSGENSALVRIGGEGGLLDKARVEGGTPGPSAHTKPTSTSARSCSRPEGAPTCWPGCATTASGATTKPSPASTPSGRRTSSGRPPGSPACRPFR